MSKIKIKDIEGDSEALSKFFKDSDCSLSDYLNIKNQKVSVWPFVIFSLLFIVCSCILPNVQPVGAFYQICLVLEFVFLGAMVLTSYLRWNSWSLALCIALCALVVAGVALKVMTPEDAINTVGNTIEKKLE